MSAHQRVSRMYVCVCARGQTSHYLTLRQTIIGGVITARPRGDRRRELRGPERKCVVKAVQTLYDPRDMI